MTGLRILEFLKDKKRCIAPSEIALTLTLDPNTTNARCQQFFREHLLDRIAQQSTITAKPVWFYTITSKGKKYLSLKKQLKALLTHEQ